MLKIRFLLDANIKHFSFGCFALQSTKFTAVVFYVFVVFAFNMFLGVDILFSLTAVSEFFDVCAIFSEPARAKYLARRAQECTVVEERERRKQRKTDGK